MKDSTLIVAAIIIWSALGLACLAPLDCFAGQVAAGQKAEGQGAANTSDDDRDTIEFLNGAKLHGRMKEIRKESKEFDFEVQLGSRESTRTFPYSQVHAVTFNGKRFVLTPLPDGNAEDGSGAGDREAEQPQSNTDSAPTNEVAGESRSRAEVLELIQRAGRTPPSWFDSTPLNYPDSLDLTWPIKAEGPWNASKNVGQFIWDRVNPNESRWRSGIKLVHECLARHSGDKALLKRDMQKLGEMYFTLLQDYPRAAFWLQKSSPAVRTPSGIHLAECYWRLGNKPMAMAAMRGQTLHWNAIKLLGEMGEIKAALQVAQVYSRTNAFNEAFLSAGDALRSAGRLDEAIQYYQKVLETKEARSEDYKQRYMARAAGAIEAIRLFDQADVSRVSDGTYTDASTGYNGELKVRVEVANRRISSVEVTSHREKQFYAALTDTPKQIIRKQSIRDIDGTSGATITSQAIVHATARALAQGAE